MTDSRGIRVRRGTRIEWADNLRGRLYCQCGCGGTVPIEPIHFNTGIPRFIHGHNVRVAPSRSNGGHSRHSAGYMQIRTADHPFRDSRGYVMEHRLVMEEHLRNTDPDHPSLVDIDMELYIDRGWDVHHRNGDKTDNRIENLEVLTTAEHSRLHGKIRGSLNY